MISVIDALSLKNVFLRSLEQNTRQEPKNKNTVQWRHTLTAGGAQKIVAGRGNDNLQGRLYLQLWGRGQQNFQGEIEVFLEVSEN